MSVRMAACLCVATCAAMAQPVLAETTEVTAQGVHAYNVSKALMRRGDGPLSAADAALFKRAILADTQVDPAERQMLDALIEGTPYTVNPPKYGSAVAFTRLASEEAKLVLRQIQSFSYDDPVLQNWMEATEQSVGSVVALYMGTADQREQAIGSLFNRIVSVWRENRWDNDFRKLEAELAGWSTRCNTQSGASYRACRTLVFDVMVKADRGLDGSTDGGIPDFIYDRFKPKED